MTSLTIRLATAADADAVRRLAQLDSQPVPAGELLLAEADGVVLAAIATADGRVLADPFRHTADAAAVLRARAAQLTPAPRAGRRLRLALSFAP